MASIDDWKTVEEAARLLRVTTRRIRQLIEEGSLKARKKGRDYLIYIDEINRYRRERE